MAMVENSNTRSATILPTFGWVSANKHEHYNWFNVSTPPSLPSSVPSLPPFVRPLPPSLPPLPPSPLFPLLYLFTLDGVPSDGTPTNQTRTISFALFVTYSIFTSLGIFFALFCFIFNVMFRNRKLVPVVFTCTYSILQIRLYYFCA